MNIKTFKLQDENRFEYTEAMNYRNAIFAILIALLSQEYLTNLISLLFRSFNLSNLFSSYVLQHLFATGITTIILIIYCKFIEKRGSNGLGLKIDKKTFLRYIIGLCLGLLAFSVMVAVGYATHVIKYLFPMYKGYEFTIFITFIGFIIQGMSEEVMVRGTLMVGIAKDKGIVPAIIISSLFFAFLHIGNNGINVLALINLTLFGIFASLYYYHTNSLWGVCAFHTMWNFAQGNIFGLPVSGIPFGSSIFRFYLLNISSYKKIFTGKSFGLEGSIQCTLVLLIGIGVILYREKKKTKKAL